MPGFWRIGGRDICGRGAAGVRIGAPAGVRIEAPDGMPGLEAEETLEVGRSPGLTVAGRAAGEKAEPITLELLYPCINWRFWS